MQEYMGKNKELVVKVVEGLFEFIGWLFCGVGGWCFGNGFDGG